MRLIDVDKLNAEMYHEAYETDTDLQKWENGCWIRYKMYENATDNAPTVDAVPMSVIDNIITEIEQIRKEDMECDGCSDMGMVLDIIYKLIGRGGDKYDKRTKAYQ